MSKKKIAYFIFIFLLSYLYGNGQTTNYSIKKINNVDYYVYAVQAGEGLYTISKKFNVTEAEITELNPITALGLKPNQELLIPINSANKTIYQKEKLEKNPSYDNQDFIEHKVLKKQTLYAISRTYKVDISDIQNANPQILNGLQEGMIIKIPKRKASESKEIKQKDEPKIIEESAEFIEHRVKLKETLYSISKLYNLSVNDILKYNPETQENLRWGSKLRIIVKKPEKQAVKDSVVENKPKVNLDDKLSISGISKQVITNKTPIRIAFLLPFMLENGKSDASNQRFIEFYSGALLAINEAKEFGVSFEIYTHDTGRTEEQMSEVLQNEDLKNVDLIVGPAYTQQIPLVSNFALKHKIHTLIPFSSKVYDVNINPYILQFNPSLEVQVQFLAQILNNEYKNKDILFCDIQSVSLLDDAYEFNFELKNELKRLKRNFVTIDADSLVSSTVDTKHKITKNTVLFFNTDKFAAVSSYIDSINSKSFANKIELFRQLNWPNSASNQQSFYISPFSLDFNSSDYKKYSAAFYKTFTWISASNAPRFDLIGYDLMKYFSALLYQNGTNIFNQKNKLPLNAGIQSNLQFVRKSDKSGFMNQKIYFFENNKTE